MRLVYFTESGGSVVYPLRFKPKYREYIWGGRRFESVLDRELGDGDTYAESWELVDHGEDQSVVANGDFTGLTLRELVTRHGAALFGQHHPQPNFPLLFKFVDAHRNLSVQVHPNDEQAGQLDPPDLGKTEAWVIMDARPGATIYAGLKRGFDRDSFAREVARGTCELCLNQIHPQPGDCIFVPAGLVHAIGAGLLIAEIQQSSNTTFRLFDWNRVRPDGQPRDLHIEQALDTINYGLGPTKVQQPVATDDPAVWRLVRCDKFVLDKWTIDQPKCTSADQRFHVLSVLSGAVDVAGDPSGLPVSRGQTVLVPASSIPVTVAPRTASVVLDMYLP